MEQFTLARLAWAGVNDHMLAHIILNFRNGKDTNIAEIRELFLK